MTAGGRLGEVLALVLVDETGTVRSVSPAAERLFGLTEAEARGRPLWESFHREASAAEGMAGIERVLATGQALPARRTVVERRDGAPVQVFLSAMPDPEARGVLFLHVPLDALERSEARRLAAFEEIPAGLLVLDGDGRVVAANRVAAELMGHEPGALDGTLPARTGGLPEGLVERLLQFRPDDAGKAFEEDVDLVPADGNRRALRVLGRGTAGAGAVVLLLDATSRRRLAVERDEARASLAATIRKPARVEPAPSGEGRRPRVLVADDSDDNRELFAHVLRARGADVAAASSGEEALAEAEARGFDLALVDLQMPGMDGFELLRRLRALPGLRPAPIVAVTALTSDDARERCRWAGFDEWVSKPVTVRRLAELLERFT